MAGLTFIRNFALLTAILTLPCILQAAQLNPNGDLTADTPVSSSGLVIETVIVNSNGSTCSTPTATDAPLTSLTTSTAAATFTTASHATSQICSVPVCPALNGTSCTDVAGSTYEIFCDFALEGLVAFPPTHKKRTVAVDAPACMAICDLEGGCHGVTYDKTNSNCLLYGSFTGMQAQVDSVAARKNG